MNSDMRELKIGFLQQHNTADVNNNRERLAQQIARLARQGAALIVLQELHNSLYFCQTENVDLFDLAEPIPGPYQVPQRDSSVNWQRSLVW